MNNFERLKNGTAPLREQLVQHPVYQTVNSVQALRIFMEHHVFAVWDFMSLLKRLQQLQTGLELPWRPKRSTLITRFINDIVLGEESDQDGSGGYISHFEMYRTAMKECGASTQNIDDLLRNLDDGQNISHALARCGAERSVIDFVETTWSFVSCEKPHCVAAAFTLGREDIIPDMFRQCVAMLSSQHGQRLQRFTYYLERHIDLDENSHAPMALKVMHELCGEDVNRWNEAAETVRIALRARISLWDGIVKTITNSQASALAGM